MGLYCEEILVYLKGELGETLVHLIYRKRPDEKHSASLGCD